MRKDMNIENGLNFSCTYTAKQMQDAWFAFQKKFRNGIPNAGKTRDHKKKGRVKNGKTA